MASRRSHFGDLERAVMDMLWGLPSGVTCTVREVHDRVGAGRGLAYTTVMTVLQRLARKELVRQERDGRAYRYCARTSRAEMTAGLMAHTLDDFSEAERTSALMAFVGKASPADLATLRRALAATED